jgi:hypothetical protein
MKELRFYFELFPELSKLDASISVPRALCGSLEDGALIMENLKLSGFVMQDKNKGRWIK